LSAREIVLLRIINGARQRPGPDMHSGSVHP